jgi:hypothetical protein
MKAALRAALVLSALGCSSIANANATYNPFAPAIDKDAPADVAVWPFVIDRRCDCDTESGEEAVMVMVMMVVLNKLE